MRALVVEDDPGVGDLVQEALEADGYAVDRAGDGFEALELLASFPFDLVALDLGLPGPDGLAVLAEARAGGNRVPVLVLTARDGLEDRLLGLDGGADDYLSKPFHLRELRARARALVRRAHGEAGNQLVVGRLALDLERRRAWFGGAELTLSGRETALLEFLALHASGYHPREALLEHVWPGEASVDPRTVDTYICYLRRKLGDEAIETARGRGYRLRG